MKTILYAFLFLLPYLSLGQSENVNLSNGLVFEGEPFLKINPSNSQHLIVAWMGYDPQFKIAIYTRVSFNGGETWSPKVEIEHENEVFSSADPSMDFNEDGVVYLSYVEFVHPPLTTDSGGVYIRKSFDGGLSWEASTQVMDLHDDPTKKAIDRPWLVIDRSDGDYIGTIYITSMNMAGVTNPPFNPYLHRSFDGGTTWAPWRHLDTIGWFSGQWIPHPMPTPAVSANGIFHAIYPSWVFTQNPELQYFHVSSSTGGNSFSYHTVFVDIAQANDTLSKKGFLLKTDPSNSNHLVFLYLAKDFGDTDIVMRESFNEGLTWSGATRVNDDPISNNRMQDLVWADFDDDGDLAVTWRDRRNAPESEFTTSSEIWGAVRWKDSTLFSENFIISDSLVPYDDILGATSGNDFMSSQFVNDTLFSVWGSNQNGSLNIWFQRISLLNNTTSISKMIMELSNNISIFPNPATDEINIQGENLKRILLLDINGKILIDQKVDKSPVKLNMNQFPKGVYFVRIIKSNGIISHKIIKE